MIRAVRTDEDGHRTIILGFDDNNTARIRNGDPMYVDCEQLGAPGLRIMIHYASKPGSTGFLQPAIAGHTVNLVITKANLDRLRAGRTFDLDISPAEPRTRVLLFHRPDMQALYDTASELVGPDTRIEIDPRLSIKPRRYDA